MIQCSVRFLICCLILHFICIQCGSVSAQDIDDDKFEIVAHRIRLQLYPLANAISCIDTLSIKKRSKDAEHITLKFLPAYKIERITSKGNDIDYKHEKDYLHLDDIPSDSLFDIVITYSGNLAFRSEFNLLTKDRAVLREEGILPYGRRTLQFVRISLVVPKDWETIVPGRLIRHDSFNDSTLFVWECGEPIPMIGWICAGKFWTLKDDDGGIPITVHVFEEDSSQARKILSLAKDALTYYSENFSPYRFPKLSVVEVEDWVGGPSVLAIAAPSFVMVKKLVFTTADTYNQLEAILPHEVAHQWWPLTAFIEDEDAAFLAEGMCEYSALLFNESRGTKTARDSLGHHPLLRSLLARVSKGKDLPLQQKADLRSLPTHYLKSCYVHNMLRNIVGDSVFFQLYREYARRFAAKRVSMDDFQHLAENLSERELDWFFNQWVKRKGVPRLKIYNVKSTQVGAQWKTHGRVRMVGYDKYTTFIDIGVELPSHAEALGEGVPSGHVTTRVKLGIDSAGTYHNDVPFEILSDEKPVRAILDPDGDVLKIQKLPVKLGDLRDPADGLMIVGTLHNSEYLLDLARKHSEQMERSGWSIEIKADTNITLGDLQTERVLLYGKPTENGVVEDLQGRFPLRFHRDSLVIHNETIFDSTLTLMQAIENPFIPQGIMCWIAPLSRKAEPDLLPYNHSWVLVRGKDEIASGSWEVRDEDLVVEIR
ncbi:MAG: hypothetical protein HY707_00815 [Ignavibacteriae bacterium]|nr:hypothetical protein [Ignavibacteriota bacterium]